MPEIQSGEPWEVIQSIVADRDKNALREYLDNLSPPELARALSRLEDETQAGLLTLLEPETAADLIERLHDAQAVDLIEELSPHQAAAIVEEMESDHRADLLGEMKAGDAAAILEKMAPEEAQEARKLLVYPEDTAGGLMVTEYLSFSVDLTVADVIEDLRRHAEQYSDYSVQYAYVMSNTGGLVGVLRLRDLILTPGDARVSAVMIANPVYVYVDTPLDEIDNLFTRYPFVAVPVIEHTGQMVGVVRRADIEEALSERAGQTLMRFGGIIGGEELRSMPVRIRAFRRMAWLAVNLALSLLAASVIRSFHETIEAVIAVVFFMPVIANMSGCSGNQAVAVSIRELAMGLIEPRDLFRVVWKELQLGVVTGLFLAVLLGATAYLLQGSIALGLIVGAALGLNATFALLVGAVVPLVLRLFRLDPALAAPLIVTTVSDMCGFFVLLSLTTAFVAWQILPVS